MQVVVLGDTGRSPRMQYHSLSLVKERFSVDLIGYGGSKLVEELRESDYLTHHQLSECPSFAALPRLARYAMKALYAVISLTWVMLIRTKKPCHVIVQTPPSIPTLFVAVLVCYLRGSKLIIDHHNYGHTVLALALGTRHPLVKFSKCYEVLLCRFAHANLCVSEAMKKDLEKTFGVSAITFYDRPPARFKPASLEEKHKLFKKLGEAHVAFGDKGSDSDSDTLFTQLRMGSVEMKKDRPFLLISSTSWTEDEDFGILLDALEEYNTIVANSSTLPNVLCVITGKGPLKEYYQNIIKKKDFSHVQFCTLWLSAEDYPILLGSADLGVCLH